MTQVVTQLIVDASGVKQTEAQFIASMEKMKKAAVDAGSATASSFESAQKRWVNSLGATDPVIKAQIRMEQELARQRQINTKAVELGIATQAAADAQLGRLRKQHEGLVEAARAGTAATSRATVAQQAFQSASTGSASSIAMMALEYGRAHPFIVAVSAALGLLSVDAVRSVAAFKRYEEELLATNAVIRATGGSAGQTSQSIEAMATEIGNITEVRKAGLELLKFGNIAGNVFTRALTTADDLAASGFGSISSAAFAVGKALTAPEEGLTRLRRAGIYFSDAQIAIAKNMVETGRKADAQAFVLDALEKKIGGTGAARDRGLAGAYEALSDATQRTSERWGQQITQGLRLTEIIKGLASAIDDMNKRATPEAQLEVAERNLTLRSGAVRNMGVRRGPDSLVNRSIATQAAEVERLRSQIRLAASDVDDAYESAGRNEAAAASRVLQDNVRALVFTIELETQALRKNALERAVDIQMRKAEVAPGSAGEADIRRAVNARMAAEATTQALEATKLQTEQLKIEQAALGMSVGAATAYRVEMQFRAQQQIRGVAISESEIAALRKVAQAQGEAAQAAAKAKIDRDIKFDRDTLGLSDADRQIAQQLREIYPDVTQALQSAEAAHIRWNAAWKETHDLSVSFATTFVKGLADGKNMMDALVASSKQLSSSLIDGGMKKLLSGTDTTTMAIGAAQTAVGFGLSLFAGQSEKNKAALKSGQERSLGYDTARQLASFDTQTKEGALQAFDVAALGRRMQELKEGGKAMASLEQLLSVERQQIIADFGKRAAEAEKQAEEERLRRAEEVASARLSLEDRIFAAANDNSTMAGALLEFDRRAAQERAEIARTMAEVLPDLERTQAAERLKIQEDFTQRAAESLRQRLGSLGDRLFAATNDPNTLEGKLAAFDRDARRQREEEIRAGGEAMVNLEQVLLAERLNLIKDHNDRVADEQKRAMEQQISAINQVAKDVVTFVNSLVTGPDSVLTPSQRLSAAQASYNSQLTLAQGGNLDAQGTITKYADDLLRAARDVYASAPGFQAIFEQVKTQLLGLPAVQATNDPVVQALRDVLTGVQGTTTAVAGNTVSVNTGNTLTTATNTALAVEKGVLDIINASTAATNSQVATTNALQTSANSLITTSNAFLTSMNGLLNSINTLINNTNAQLVATHGVQTTIHGDNLTIVNRLDAISLYTAKTLRNTYLSAPSGDANVGFRQNIAGLGFAEGGVVGPGTLAIFGEHHPRGPWITRTTEPVAIHPGMPPRSANDNGAVVAELRILRQMLQSSLNRIAELEQRNVDATDENTADRREQHNRDRQNARIDSRKSKVA